MTVAAFVSAWLLAHGVHERPTQAVMHYIQTESRFDPMVQSYTGHCLMQWAGSRWHRLQYWAHSVGCPRIEAQLTYALWELRTLFPCVLEASNPYPVMRRTFGRGGSC